MAKKTVRRAGRKAKTKKTGRLVRGQQKAKGRGTRRKRADFKRRSLAAKKGWRRRKARENIEKKAKEKAPKKGRLREWLVTWSYSGSHSRTVGFTVIARNEDASELFVVQAVARGHDSEGADLSWMESIPWDEVETTAPEDEPMDRKTLRALGEGYVVIH